MSDARSLPFAASARSSLGVEWELALVDRDNGDLRQVAQTILQEVGGGKPHPKIHQELLLNTVEVVTGVCQTVGEAMADLQGSIAQVQAITDPLRVELMCAGTHPFAHWSNQQVTSRDRYATLIDRTQWWGRQMLIYGVHVHIGIEDVEKVIPIQNALLTYYPHLLALSASSPFWEGRNTGYASNRALLFQQLPTAGLPFTDITTWAQFERYVADMSHTGVIEEVNDIRWDIRPSPRLGTLELRIFDGIPTQGELTAVVALVQSLVEWFSRRYDAGEELPTISPWFLAENKWRAARYGLDAIVILDRAGNEALVTESLAQLLGQLAPVAADLGCAAELELVPQIWQRGASYQRQLATANAAGGSLAAVVDQLVSEFRAGLPSEAPPLERGGLG